MEESIQKIFVYVDCSWFVSTDVCITCLHTFIERGMHFVGSCFICMCNFVCIHVSLKRLISRVVSNLHEVFEVMGCRCYSCRVVATP